jgi:predicted nucleotidyltransferase
MKTLEELRQILSPQKESLCEKYQITQLGIFGSYARGEQTASSDVDFLIDYETAPSLLKLIDLKYYLSELLDMEVDIVTKNGLKSRLRDRVLAEAIYL